MDSIIVNAIYEFEINKIAIGSIIDLIQWFLSLWLVGALSIVRFGIASKVPEQIVF